MTNVNTTLCRVNDNIKNRPYGARRYCNAHCPPGVYYPFIGVSRPGETAGVSEARVARLVKLIRGRGCFTQVNVTILDRNDNRPTWPAEPIEYRISEDVPVGSLVATLKASDADLDSTLTYAVIADNGRDTDSSPPPPLLLDAYTGNVRVGRPVDRETSARIVLPVRVSDGVHSTDTSVVFDVSTRTAFGAAENLSYPDPVLLGRSRKRPFVCAEPIVPLASSSKRKKSGQANVAGLEWGRGISARERTSYRHLAMSRTRKFTCRRCRVAC